ncbi:MAG: RsmD family RNA methyltransferase, partial [Candidatus Omnitrophota bacterium]|nr:RsmD family RNA methyltransferase [Candidatus Omnitrophota bacterium]
KKILQMLGAYDILAPNGFVVVQHFKKEQLPKESGKLTLIKEARYGDTVLSFYKKAQLAGTVPADS